MGTLPVLQQGSRAQVCLSNESLPAFYMNDYSVLGLLVANLDMVYQVLVARQIAVARKPDHLEIRIERAGQMPQIVNLLQQNGIDCGIADIADQIYQG